MKRWIFPGFLALLFAAVLLAGLVPWDRILPEKEELPADAVEIGTLDTVQPLKGDYTIQYDDPDDPEGSVTVTYHVPSVGDFPMHYDSIDDVPRSTTMTFHMPSGDFVVLFGDGDNVPAQVSVPRPVTASTEWEINSPGTVNVEGDTSYCRFRTGDPENWVIYLAGGGMSLDAYTAEHPRTFYTTGTAWNGIWDSAFFSADEVNPFRDWSYLLIPCDTADCYIGAGEFTSVRGTVLHHNGYTNFTDYLEAFAFARPTPDKILLAGSSAGGFGAAMLAPVVLEMFPDTEVTVLVDCACLSADWQRIARDVWHAPEEITDRMETDDCVTDALVAAAETYGGRLKILYLAVESDATLIQYQEYLNTGDFAISPEARNHYNETLKAAVKRLREAVPDAGIWIWRRSPADALSTPVHMIIPRFGSKYDVGNELLTNGISWVWNAVMHDAPPLSFGLDGFLDD